MGTSQLLSIPDRGTFDARYLAFLETITHLRPQLHRYCARMTGSALDGEDVMQDALFQAYRKLWSFDDTVRWRPGCFASRTTSASIFFGDAKCARVPKPSREVDELVRPPDAVGGDLDRAIEHLFSRFRRRSARAFC